MSGPQVLLGFILLLTFIGSISWGVLAFVLKILTPSTSKFCCLNTFTFATMVVLVGQTLFAQYSFWVLPELFMLMAIFCLNLGIIRLYALEFNEWSLISIVTMSATLMIIFQDRPYAVSERGVIFSTAAFLMFIIAARNMLHANIPKLGIVKTILITFPFFLAILIYVTRVIVLLSTAPENHQYVSVLSEEGKTLVWGFIILILTINIAILLSTFIRIHDELIEVDQKDSLTGVFNRKTMCAKLEYIHGQSQSDSDIAYQLAWIDINYLDVLREEFGIAAARNALVHSSQLLLQNMRKQDDIGLYSESGFLVIFRDVDDLSAAELASKLVSVFADEPFNHQNESFILTANFGLIRNHRHLHKNDLLQEIEHTFKTT